MFSCNNKENTKLVSAPVKTDKIYQYSVFTALANKIYDGAITVADVKKKGNTGLGTYNGLNGEMIVNNGEVYQCLADGTVRKPANLDSVPFAVVSFFEEDQTVEIQSVGNYAGMKTEIEKCLPSKNLAYTFKIHGNFATIKYGSAAKQTKPYTQTLSEALVNRPIFELENVAGTLVGFWYPEYIGDINVPGFHLHFISDDKKYAGHLLELSAAKLQIGIDFNDGFDIELVNTNDFKGANFDLSQKYNTKK